MDRNRKILSTRKGTYLSRMKKRKGKIYIAIDNGTTGSIGIITPIRISFGITPIKTEQNYTKKKQNISRIDYNKMLFMLSKYKYHKKRVKVLLERPFTGQFNKANVSAARAIESTLIALEVLNYSHEYIDSKEWQSVMLPKGIKGSSELKKASLDIACRLFPQLREKLIKHKDGDSILMAEWARRLKL